MSEHEDNAEPIKDRLQGWDPAVPPSGFADRVAAAWETERTPARPRWGRMPWRVVAVALVAVLGVGVAALLWPGSGGSTGQLASTGRTTVAIGSRAVAVAEDGAAMQWRVGGDGAVVVEQPQGRVFYRVQPGEAFDVTTPGGSVRVTGTCFTADVIDMNERKTIKGMAIGAGVATALVVTVYEGGVVLADEGGSIELAAGERGSTAGKHGPSRLGDDDGWGDGGRDDSDADADHADNIPLPADLSTATPAALAARVRTQARQLERLRASRADMEAELDDLRAAGGKRGPLTREAQVDVCAHATRGESGCSFFDPEDDVLVEMARCGVIKVDQPSFLVAGDDPASLGGGLVEAGVLTGEESETLTKAAVEFRKGYEGRIRELYVDAGGDPDMVEDGNVRALLSMTDALFEAGELGYWRRQLAKERAGLAQPPADADRTLGYEYVRATADVGNNFETAVGKALGADRARELRGLDDGWPGGTSVYSGNCED